MKCAHCGARLREGANFCTHCGARAGLQSSANVCSRCDAQIATGDVFCTQCGTPASAAGGAVLASTAVQNAVSAAGVEGAPEAVGVRRRRSILPFVAALTLIIAAGAAYLTRPLDKSELAPVPRAKDTTPDVNRPGTSPDASRSATAAPPDTRGPGATGVQ